MLGSAAEPFASQSGSSELRCRIKINWIINTAHKITIHTGKGQTRNASAWNPQEYEYKSPMCGSSKTEMVLARKCKTTNTDHIKAIAKVAMVGFFIF
ncbi:MAG: hypothetical protein EAZ42_00350 [Verrucomicrobia bacterium]|nr:MAG: hypothetical protein EAZ42_00350 [Verrucomicrobiota bacterium]